MGLNSISKQDLNRARDIGSRVSNPLGTEEIVALCEWLAGVPLSARTQAIRSDIELQLIREVDSQSARQLINKILVVLKNGGLDLDEAARLRDYLNGLQKQVSIAVDYKRLRVADKRDFMKPRAAIAGAAFYGEERWTIRDKRTERTTYDSNGIATVDENGIASGVAGLQQLAENCCPTGFESPDAGIMKQSEKRHKAAEESKELSHRLNKANRKRGRKAHY
jgi:hypothetical protein